jgi:hypothetical protein
LAELVRPAYIPAMDTVGPPHSEVLQEEVDDEVLLLDSRTGKYFSLNRTAGDVWRLADGQMSADQIVAALAVAYQVEPNTIRNEVNEIIDGFAAAGLFQPSSAVT